MHTTRYSSPSVVKPTTTTDELCWRHRTHPMEQPRRLGESRDHQGAAAPVEPTSFRGRINASPNIQACTVFVRTAASHPRRDRGSADCKRCAAPTSTSSVVETCCRATNCATRHTETSASSAAVNNITITKSGRYVKRPQRYADYVP